MGDVSIGRIVSAEELVECIRCITAAESVVVIDDMRNFPGGKDCVLVVQVVGGRFPLLVSVYPANELGLVENDLDFYSAAAAHLGCPLLADRDDSDDPYLMVYLGRNGERIHVSVDAEVFDECGQYEIDQWNGVD